MRRFPIALLLVLAAAIPVAAQLPADTTASSLTRAIGGLRQGDVIRVALERARWVGQFERIGGDTLFFGTAGQQPMAIRLNAIDTLWRRTSAARRGSAIGAATFGLLGGLAGAYLAGAYDGGWTTGRVIQYSVVGALVGTAVGVMAGGLVGSTGRTWRRVHP